jgi:hypothetical protein
MLVASASRAAGPRRREVLPALLHYLPAGSCTWQEGGRFLPGTINNFGGSSTTEFGPLLKVLFPEPGFTTSKVFVDFNSGNRSNPCPARR